MRHLDSLQRFIHNDEENMRRYAYGRPDGHDRQMGLKRLWGQSADIERSRDGQAVLAWLAG